MHRDAFFTHRKLQREAGDVAISHRGQFQDLTVKIAAALGVPCNNFKSEIIHAQYMELGQRILENIAENAEADGRRPKCPLSDGTSSAFHPAPCSSA